MGLLARTRSQEILILSGFFWISGAGVRRFLLSLLGLFCVGVVCALAVFALFFAVMLALAVFASAFFAGAASAVVIGLGAITGVLGVVAGDGERGAQGEGCEHAEDRNGFIHMRRLPFVFFFGIFSGQSPFS